MTDKPRYRVETGLSHPAWTERGDSTSNFHKYYKCYWIYDRANVVQCVIEARRFSGGVDTRNKRAKLVADRICEAMNTSMGDLK